MKSFQVFVLVTLFVIIFGGCSSSIELPSKDNFEYSVSVSTLQGNVGDTIVLNHTLVNKSGKKYTIEYGADSQDDSIFDHYIVINGVDPAPRTVAGFGKIIKIADHLQYSEEIKLNEPGEYVIKPSLNFYIRTKVKGEYTPYEIVDYEYLVDNITIQVE